MSGPGGAEIKAASEGVAALAKSLGVAGDAGSDRRIRVSGYSENTRFEIGANYVSGCNISKRNSLALACSVKLSEKGGK